MCGGQPEECEEWGEEVPAAEERVLPLQVPVLVLAAAELEEAPDPGDP